MKKNLELYLHIPFCVKKCAYCDFLSFASDEQTQMEYADALIREIRFYGSVFRSDSSKLHPKEKWGSSLSEFKLEEQEAVFSEYKILNLNKEGYAVSSIFIGGGTPSWLHEDKIVEILEALHQNFHILSDAEITIECNPGTVTRAKLEKYKKAGINRLSIGLQSADNEELRLLGRIHTFEQFLKTYTLARECGFENINIDVISGIPYQTTEKFLQTLKKVVALKPNHISAYSLIIEPNTPFYETYYADLKRQEAGKETQILPTEDEICQMLEKTQQFFKQNGYEQYEISNFAKSGFVCKHNIGYWTRENYLGLGLGAASLIENVRYSNVTDLYTYIKETKHMRFDISETHMFFQKEWEPNVLSLFIKTNLHDSMEILPRYAQMEEFMFLGLRMKEGISREKFYENFGISIEGIYQKVLVELKEKGLLEQKEGRIALTEQGERVSNYVMAQFLLGETEM